MFKFLKVFSNEVKEPELETMRARFERVTAELNEVLTELEELPELRIDVAGRQIMFAAPDQFSDEALALPKPDPAPEQQEQPAKPGPVSDASPNRAAKDASAASTDTSSTGATGTGTSGTGTSGSAADAKTS